MLGRHSKTGLHFWLLLKMCTINIIISAVLKWGCVGGLATYDPIAEGSPTFGVSDTYIHNYKHQIQEKRTSTTIIVKYMECIAHVTFEYCTTICARDMAEDTLNCANIKDVYLFNVWLNWTISSTWLIIIIQKESKRLQIGREKKCFPF